MYYYGPMAEGYDWGWGIFMMMLWFLVLAVVTVLLVRQVRGHPISMWQGGDPLDIAKQRYAKGEINKEQFEQLKKDLAQK